MCIFVIGTIFAYGQSSSGKTFTMSGTRMQPGVITLAIQEIFSNITNVSVTIFIVISPVQCSFSFSKKYSAFPVLARNGQYYN